MVMVEGQKDIRSVNGNFQWVEKKCFCKAMPKIVISLHTITLAINNCVMFFLTK
jgi:hypothetical protein